MILRSLPLKAPSATGRELLDTPIISFLALLPYCLWYQIPPFSLLVVDHGNSSDFLIPLFPNNFHRIGNLLLVTVDTVAELLDFFWHTRNNVRAACFIFFLFLFNFEACTKLYIWAIFQFHFLLPLKLLLLHSTENNFVLGQRKMEATFSSFCSFLQSYW